MTQQEIGVEEPALSFSALPTRLGSPFAMMIWGSRTGDSEAQCNSSLFLLWQVQFDEREDTKSCTIIINDDDVFENIESFTVELSMPAYALLGEFTQAKVIINDTEDEPTLEFDKKTYRVNESAGFLFAPIERKGLLVPKMTASYNNS